MDAQAYSRKVGFSAPTSFTIENVQTHDDTDAIEAGVKELRNAETNHYKVLDKEKKLASQVQKAAAKE